MVYGASMNIGGTSLVSRISNVIFAKAERAGNNGRTLNASIIARYSSERSASRAALTVTTPVVGSTLKGGGSSTAPVVIETMSPNLYLMNVVSPSPPTSKADTVKTSVPTVVFSNTIGAAMGLKAKSLGGGVITYTLMTV